MKKIVLAVFMAAMALSLSAQINFREGGFAEALEAAKSENKLVFMDCYTSCGRDMMSMLIPPCWC